MAAVAARALAVAGGAELKRSLSFFSEIGGEPRQLRRTMSCTSGLEGQPTHAEAAKAPPGKKGGAAPKVLSLDMDDVPEGRVREATAFVLWILVFLVSVVSIPTLWVLFWRNVVRAEHPEQSFALWCTAALCAFYYRNVVARRSPLSVQPILWHAELFMGASMLCTMSANTAFFFHTPGERLFDLGFTLVPEQAIDSPWRPLSDVLTIGLPFVMVSYSLLFCGRAERSQLVVDWFRLVAISYLLRAVTLVLTSLPGPAPHCDPSNGVYKPPSDLVDVLTNLGPLYGAFNTCGDLLFSGHTAWTTVTLLLFLRTTRRMRYPRLRFGLACAYLCTMMVFAIAGRKHYTVDLALAVIVSTLVFAQFERGWTPAALAAEGAGASLLSPRSPRAKELVEIV